MEKVKHLDHRDLKLVALLLAIGVVVFHLSMAVKGHSITRDQHLATAICYAKGKIDLMNPILPGFNANGSPTPLEFPIWQALTAVLMKKFGIWYGWGNVVSLAFMLSTVALLFDLARRIYSERVAWWTAVFALAQPLNIIIGGQAGADSTAWALAVCFIYAAYRMMEKNSWGWWIAAVVAGSLSAITKAPFFMTVGLTAFFWLLLKRRLSVIAWIQLALAGIVSMAIFMIWNGHAHRLYALAEFPLVNMDILGKEGEGIAEWYFGTFHYRLDPANWVRGGWRFMCYVVGNFGLAVLALAAVRLRKISEIWLWLLAAVCTTMVFTPLILDHFHYFFIYSAAFALLCASAAHAFEEGAWQRLQLNVPGRFVLVMAAIVFSLVQATQTIHFNQFLDPWKNESARIIKEHTEPTDKLVVWGGIWCEPFARCERDGLTGGFSTKNIGWLNDPTKLARLKELGYTRLVLMNPSPYLVALTVATGTQREQAKNLVDELPDVAKNWPVLFSSPQILILQIPK